MGSTIQMISGANPADALAAIDVPGSGFLIGVDWAVRGAVSGADLTQQYQVSFASVSMFTSNDARAVISNIGLVHDFTTSGGAALFANKYVSLPDIAVSPGERIYLHGVGTAAATTVTVLLHFSFDVDRPRTRLR